MIQSPFKKRGGPIGIDLGAGSVKLVQFNADRTRLLAAARWDVEIEESHTPAERVDRFAQALGRARDGRAFQGRDAVLCLGERELFVQNIRVPKLAGEALEKVVRQEAAGRIPHAVEETELRYLEAADVRQGDSIKREVIVLACHRPVLEQQLAIAERAGLRPVAVDVEPAALLRCYYKQFRRDEDRQQRIALVHIGSSNTAVMIAHAGETVFVKYIEIGGRHLDEAVAQHLHMEPREAAALRRHNGDRRADQQDPEVARSVAEAVRPVLDRLTAEIGMCLRYHSVTFRGQPIDRLLLGGGEATAALTELFQQRLELRCELGEPLRSYEQNQVSGRKAQWDVAAGLALRDMN